MCETALHLPLKSIEIGHLRVVSWNSEVVSLKKNCNGGETPQVVNSDSGNLTQ